MKMATLSEVKSFSLKKTTMKTIEIMEQISNHKLTLIVALIINPREEHMGQITSNRSEEPIHQTTIKLKGGRTNKAE